MAYAHVVQVFLAFMHFVIKGVALLFIRYFNCVLAPGIHIRQILSGILYWNLCGGSIYDQCRCFWHFLLLPQEVATDCELHWWMTLFCIWGILCFFCGIGVVFLCAGVFSISNCCRKRSPASPAALVDTVLTQQLLPTLLSYHCQGRAAAGFKHRHWCVLWVLFWKWWQSSPAELFSEITLFSFGFHLGVYSGLV